MTPAAVFLEKGPLGTKALINTNNSKHTEGSSHGQTEQKEKGNLKKAFFLMD